MKGHTQDIVDQNQKKKNIETEERGRDRDRKIGERKTGTEKIVKKDINIIDEVDQDHGTITEAIEGHEVILMTTLL